MNPEVDALIVVSFGGPEKPEEVMPFLERVTRGRNIPRERLLQVAEHYHHFGGKSPINDQNRELISALRALFDAEGPPIPIYWGNRNWHPLLEDTVREMRDAGVRTAAAFITSAYGSYSGCRQYMEDLARARKEAGEGAPEIYPLPLFYNHPGFVGPMSEHIQAALDQFAVPPPLVFTAHSVPLAMASTSSYAEQLQETCTQISDRLGHPEWTLVYQSRSGPPSQPWLEPDILDHIRSMHAGGIRELVIAPIGFISDHMEVKYDLDTEAAALCEELGMKMVRAATVGSHPVFVRMIRDLLSERRRCRLDCCPAPIGRPTASSDRSAESTGPREG